MRVVHGEGKPKLVMDLGLGTETTVILPYCKSLTEKFDPEVITKQLYNGTKSVKKKGFWYYATLDYSDRFTADVLQSLDQASLGGSSLFDSERVGDMWFYPRNDNADIKYKVEIDEGTGIVLRQRPFHDGHKGIIIKLEGLQRMNKIDFRG